MGRLGIFRVSAASSILRRVNGSFEALRLSRKSFLTLLAATGIAASSAGTTAFLVGVELGHSGKPSEQSKVTTQGSECRNERSSELCAQWKAADAAEASAFWAEWSFWISTLGLGGLLFTLHYTRKAVLAAEEATKESEKALAIASRNAAAAAKGAANAARAASSAQEANYIAREAMERQLRPFVYIFDQQVAFQHVAAFEYIVGDSAEASFSIQNFGKSPAKNVTFTAHAVIGDHWCDRQAEIVAEALSQVAVVPLADIPPQHIRHRPGYLFSGLKKAYQDIEGGTKSVFLEGQIRYSDDFGSSYYTNFQLALTGSGHVNEPPSATPHWNDAT